MCGISLTIVAVVHPAVVYFPSLIACSWLRLVLREVPVENDRFRAPIPCPLNTVGVV